MHKKNGNDDTSNGGSDNTSSAFTWGAKVSHCFDLMDKCAAVKSMDPTFSTHLGKLRTEFENFKAAMEIAFQYATDIDHQLSDMRNLKVPPGDEAGSAASLDNALQSKIGQCKLIESWIVVFDKRLQVNKDRIVEIECQLNGADTEVKNKIQNAKKYKRASQIAIICGVLGLQLMLTCSMPATPEAAAFGFIILVSVFFALYFHVEQQEMQRMESYSKELSDLTSDLTKLGDMIEPFGPFWQTKNSTLGNVKQELTAWQKVAKEAVEKRKSVKASDNEQYYSTFLNNVNRISDEMEAIRIGGKNRSKYISD
ncbi:hypothetical protein BC936DRAFT_146530 [Jimgerdemannia flammicorona]|uniref:Uncharacterized protein n=1 Tax=Jimgerdemannia flammicorona TaxID=994334 RepID=A0A433D7H3_9FUNG|nr:hypothetical protein BC936DRAFT_146530 [Jimgerdemannia flammicorona]